MILMESMQIDKTIANDPESHHQEKISLQKRLGFENNKRGYDDLKYHYHRCQFNWTLDQLDVEKNPFKVDQLTFIKCVNAALNTLSIHISKFLEIYRSHF
jgi:hypothetical protein